jgi:protein KRI1
MRQVALESVLNPNSRSPSPQPVPHVEEQRALRNETIAAFRHAVEEDDEDDGLFVPREKTKDEREREEEEYQSFLKREVGQDLAELVTVDADMALGEASFEQKDGESKKNKNKKKDNKTSKAKSASKTKHEADQEFLLKCVNWHLLLSFFLFCSP